VHLSMHVGSGFYVRSLARDLGAALGQHLTAAAAGAAAAATESVGVDGSQERPGAAAACSPAVEMLALDECVAAVPVPAALAELVRTRCGSFSCDRHGGHASAASPLFGSHSIAASRGLTGAACEPLSVDATCQPLAASPHDIFAFGASMEPPASPAVGLAESSQRPGGSAVSLAGHANTTQQPQATAAAVHASAAARPQTYRPIHASSRCGTAYALHSLRRDTLHTQLVPADEPFLECPAAILLPPLPELLAAQLSSRHSADAARGGGTSSFSLGLLPALQHAYSPADLPLLVLDSCREVASAAAAALRVWAYSTKWPVPALLLPPHELPSGPLAGLTGPASPAGPAASLGGSGQSWLAQLAAQSTTAAAAARAARRKDDDCSDVPVLRVYMATQTDIVDRLPPASEAAQGMWQAVMHGAWRQRRAAGAGTCAHSVAPMAALTTPVGGALASVGDDTEAAGYPLLQPHEAGLVFIGLAELAPTDVVPVLPLGRLPGVCVSADGLTAGASHEGGPDRPTLPLTCGAGYIRRAAGLFTADAAALAMQDLLQQRRPLS